MRSAFDWCALWTSLYRHRSYNGRNQLCFCGVFLQNNGTNFVFHSWTLVNKLKNKHIWRSIETFSQFRQQHCYVNNIPTVSTQILFFDTKSSTGPPYLALTLNYFLCRPLRIESHQYTTNIKAARLGQYHGCWWTVYLSHQVISRFGIFHTALLCHWAIRTLETSQHPRQAVFLQLHLSDST